MLAKSPIYIYNSMKFGPALGDVGEFGLLYFGFCLHESFDFFPIKFHLYFWFTRQIC